MLVNKGIDIAKRYAPRVFFDNNEPFFPFAVAYTIAKKQLESPSFDRVLNPPKDGFIIEYAIYWDWDIGHHYDLEHLWVHVNSKGKVEAFEGSAHGLYINLWPNPPELGALIYQLENKEKGNRYCRGKGYEDFSQIYSSGNGLITYSQPGKHGFSPTPDWYEEQKDYIISVCTEQAGNSGMLGGIYGDRLQQGPEDRNLLAEEYLKEHAFMPSLIFEKKIDLGLDYLLIPWDKLYQLIPKRVDKWMSALAVGKTI